MRFHGKRFPAESAEYRSRREELLEAEIELRDRIEQVARQRRTLPMSGPVREDYVFETLTAEGAKRPVRLSELFSPEKKDLIVYNFMFGPQMDAPCPMCTSIIDGLNATAPHVTQRADLVVVAKSPIERVTDFAKTRCWDRVRLLSSSRNRYNRDYWGEDESGNQYPMLNVFVRNDEGIHHFWGSELLYVATEGEPRHADLIWPLWNLLDLTPGGRGEAWHPKLSYAT